MSTFMRVAVVGLSLCIAVPAATIFVGGPSPVAPFGGTVIDFEGLAEGAAVPALGGVTFSQPDGGTPIADNKSFLFAYESSSGRGVLTGGPPSVPTTAGIIATFSTLMTRGGAFFSDTAPLGDYTITAYGAGGVVLESLVVTAASLPKLADPGCDPSSPYDGTGCGVFVGFQYSSPMLKAIQFGPSSAGVGADAFAIDDLRFTGGGAVPEPGTMFLLGAGLVAVWLKRRF